MLTKTKSIFLVLFILVVLPTYSQEVMPSDTSDQKQSSKNSKSFFDDFDDKPRGKKAARIVFYNVENLFDFKNDPLKNDDEFTPEGMRGWTESRYFTKLKNTYKTLSAIGGWEAPEIVGFCEIENREVLFDLCNKTPLYKYNYQIIHEESGDRRGIDVGLIYRPEKFKPYAHTAVKLKFNDDTTYKTRDILFVSGKLFNKDTVHIFVNHWPSKFGGAKETEDRRMDAAKLVRSKCDSILKKSPSARIIVMGDLNDEPIEPSIINGLKALQPIGEIKDTDLYNLMSVIKTGGTHKYQMHWSIIDQFVVSGSLLNSKKGLGTYPENAKIFKAEFLVVPDETNLGEKPNRTYNGMQYNGGFSDHLPIYLDVFER